MPPSYRKPLYRMKKKPEEGNPPFIGIKSGWGPGRNEEPCTTGTGAHSHVACHFTRSTLPTALPSHKHLSPARSSPQQLLQAPCSRPKARAHILLLIREIVTVFNHIDPL